MQTSTSLTTTNLELQQGQQKPYDSPYSIQRRQFLWGSRSAPSNLHMRGEDFSKGKENVAK